MATPESLVKALASGLVEALLKTEKAEKPARPVVVKTDDVQAAVRSYLQEILTPDQPAQPDLFSGVGLDPTDELEHRARVDEINRRAAEPSNNGEPEPGTYNPDDPQGAPWTSPVSS